MARCMAMMLMALVTSNHMDRAEATNVFETQYNRVASQFTGERPVLNVSQFLTEWSKHPKTDVPGKDLPRSGRPSKVSDADAKRLAQAFMRGTTYTLPGLDGAPDDQHRRHFVNVADAKRHCPEIQQYLSQHNVTHRTLLARMQAVEPKLVQKSEDCKLKFSQSQKEERQRGARKLQEYADYLDAVVWIDCGSFCLGTDCRNRKVWCDRTQSDLRRRRPRRGAKKAEWPWKEIKVNWFIAVSAVLGPIYYGVTSGTTDIDRGEDFRPSDMQHKHYTVSTRACSNDSCSTGAGCIRALSRSM
jgi:hypothetical protein